MLIHGFQRYKIRSQMLCCLLWHKGSCCLLILFLTLLGTILSCLCQVQQRNSCIWHRFNMVEDQVIKGFICTCCTSVCEVLRYKVQEVLGLLLMSTPLYLAWSKKPLWLTSKMLLCRNSFVQMLLSCNPNDLNVLELLHQNI